SGRGRVGRCPPGWPTSAADQTLRAAHRSTVDWRWDRTSKLVNLREVEQECSPLRDGLKAVSYRAAAGRFAAPFACSARRAKAPGVETASSERLLRSSVIPAFFSPFISCPYVTPFSRAAALMRTIHRRRKSRFLLRRPTNAYFSAVSTDSFAARYSLLLLA